ncbi:hypothetical protein [uncultured Lacinutrix sp.]|uniref:hypothetical protein n=1 Tax=uncultured Lacinutrix sp. TaxID=574032 RepID=UPI00261B8DD2|nr:hypothetical protein [uncultured Lacinutrix sp.]
MNYLIMLLTFVFISCSSKTNINEDIKVVNKVYNSILIPKYVPAPPPIYKNSDSIEPLKKVDFSNIEKIKYAIYKKFVNSKIENIPNKFRVYKSEKLFEHINLSEKEYVLLQNLNNNSEGFINIEAFKKLNKEDIIFVEQQFINREEKKESGIDGVVSFSKVSFSSEKDKAVVAVGVYRSGLDSSYTLYLLEKKDNNWQIKSFKVISVS